MLSSPVRVGRQIMTPSRRIHLEGAKNVRDVGGHFTHAGSQVRWRTLFRADSLHRLSDLDQRMLVQEHRIRTVIDLRWNHECAESPNVFCASDRVSYRWIPLLPEPQPGVAFPYRSLSQLFSIALDTRSE